MLTVDQEIRIGWTGEYFEVELHDEKLSNDTQIEFETADSTAEALDIVKKWLGR